MSSSNLLGVPETLLPAETEVLAALESQPVADVVTAHPESSLAWALLSGEAARDGRIIESYAFARVGYHRGLDSLRKNGWRGQGPIPWSHEPNRGVLRSLYELRRAASAIGETAEFERLGTFLNDSDPRVIPALDAE